MWPGVWPKLARATTPGFRLEMLTVYVLMTHLSWTERLQQPVPALSP